MSQTASRQPGVRLLPLVKLVLQLLAFGVAAIVDVGGVMLLSQIGTKQKSQLRRGFALIAGHANHPRPGFLSYGIGRVDVFAVGLNEAAQSAGLCRSIWVLHLRRLRLAQPR